MAIRIVGVDLPQNKRGEIALTYIYGIGRSSSAKILDKAVNCDSSLNVETLVIRERNFTSKRFIDIPRRSLMSKLHRRRRFSWVRTVSVRVLNRNV